MQCCDATTGDCMPGRSPTKSKQRKHGSGTSNSKKEYKGHKGKTYVWCNYKKNRKSPTNTESGPKILGEFFPSKTHRHTMIDILKSFVGCPAIKIIIVFIIAKPTDSCSISWQEQSWSVEWSVEFCKSYHATKESCRSLPLVHPPSISAGLAVRGEATNPIVPYPWGQRNPQLLAQAWDGRVILGWLMLESV